MKKVAAKMMIPLLLAFLAVPSSAHPAGPAGNNISAAIREIDEAKSEILIQAYSLTNKDIATALANAHKRGVRTQMILDKSGISQDTSIADYARNMGIPIYIDDKGDIAGNKTIIIDRGTVITDTFNFTWTAGEKSAGSLLILSSHELAHMYMDAWNKHMAHSVEYAGRK